MKIIHKQSESKQSPLFIQARLETKAFRFSAIGRLVLPVKSGSHVIPFDEILYLKSSGNYTEVHTTKGAKILVSKTLKVIHKKLNTQFLRTHSSYIVNLNHVRQFDKSNSSIRLIDDSEIAIARSYKNEINKVFEF